VIDLRSDTVTKPSAAMRAAIAAATVGDDQYGEDPTVNLLQERVADLLGKESALFLPSGTMANQVALLALTQPGDDVIVSRESREGRVHDRRLPGCRETSRSRRLPAHNARRD
jgi:threonine aldolase